MSFEARLLAGLAASPLLLLATQSLLGRAVREASAQVTALWSIALAAVPTAALVAWSATRGPVPEGHAVSSVTYCVLVYACTGSTYFHLVNMSETARRIHLLALLHERGPLRPAEVASAYSEDGILDLRLQRLVRLGALSQDGDRVRARRGPLLWAALAVAGWRRVLFPERET